MRTSAFSFVSLALQEYVPLKQGLRLELDPLKNRELSTPGVCSTKTRIKTVLNSRRWLGIYALQEYVPLKQGLRHS